MFWSIQSHDNIINIFSLCVTGSSLVPVEHHRGESVPSPGCHRPGAHTHDHLTPLQVPPSVETRGSYPWWTSRTSPGTTLSTVETRGSYPWSSHTSPGTICKNLPLTYPAGNQPVRYQETAIYLSYSKWFEIKRCRAVSFLVGSVIRIQRKALNQVDYPHWSAFWLRVRI